MYVKRSMPCATKPSATLAALVSRLHRTGNSGENGGTILMSPLYCGDRRFGNRHADLEQLPIT